MEISDAVCKTANPGDRNNENYLKGNCGNANGDGCDTVDSSANFMGRESKNNLENSASLKRGQQGNENATNVVLNNQTPDLIKPAAKLLSVPRDISGSETGKAELVGNNKMSASLSNLLIYSSDDNSSGSSDEDEIITKKSPAHAAINLSSSSSSTDELDDIVYNSDDDSSTDEEEMTVEVATGCKKKEPQPPKTKGEFSVDDLPPVPDLSALNINVPEQECVPMGTISGIVDQFVIVDSLPNTPPYDIETLLFLSSGARPLGRIFDVMGPVSSPLYVVRFNKGDDIKSHNIHEGMPVYSAPNTEYTQYVFVKHLMQMKGSDASWVGDNEVPVEFADFSDDEQERVSRMGCKSGSRKRGSLERHKTFEKEMNSRNAEDTARRGVIKPRVRTPSSAPRQRFSRPGLPNKPDVHRVAQPELMTLPYPPMVAANPFMYPSYGFPCLSSLSSTFGYQSSPLSGVVLPNYFNQPPPPPPPPQHLRTGPTLASVDGWSNLLPELELRRLQNSSTGTRNSP